MSVRICRDHKFHIFMDGFQNNLSQLFSLMRRCAVLRFHLGRSKVKVMQARQVVPGQPFRSECYQAYQRTSHLYQDLTLYSIDAHFDASTTDSF